MDSNRAPLRARVHSRASPTGSQEQPRRRSGAPAPPEHAGPREGANTPRAGPEEDQEYRMKEPIADALPVRVPFANSQGEDLVSVPESHILLDVDPGLRGRVPP
jgi:hypothetical protein